MPPDPHEAEPTLEVVPPPPPPPEDWVYTKASPLAAIFIGLAFSVGILAKAVTDVPNGVLALIGLLLGARVAGKFKA